MNTARVVIVLFILAYYVDTATFGNRTAVVLYPLHLFHAFFKHHGIETPLPFAFIVVSSF